MLLQIMLLSSVLEDNGVDPAAILRSAGAGPGASEDSDEEDYDDEEEEGEEEKEASVASTAEEGARSPGRDGDRAQCQLKRQCAF